MNKRATENYILKFQTVSHKHPIRSLLTSMLRKASIRYPSDVYALSFIIDDIINTAVKTAEVDEQKTKYLQHFINKHDTIVSN
jgi:hypothetical protein